MSYVSIEIKLHLDEHKVTNLSEAADEYSLSIQKARVVVTGAGCIMINLTAHTKLVEISGRKRPICYHCRKAGLLVSDCWSQKKDKVSQKAHVDLVNSIQGKVTSEDSMLLPEPHVLSRHLQSFGGYLFHNLVPEGSVSCKSARK